MNEAPPSECRARVELAVHEVRRADEGESAPLLDIRGALEVRGDGEILVSLPDLPVVELAQHLDRWLIGMSPEGPDFVYTSRRARDQPGLLYFHRAPPCWRVGSILADEAHEIEASLRAVATAAGEFVARVDRLVRPLGVDLPRFLRDQAR